ncbi:MAG: lactonase family protein [Bacteroidota bacterium]
MRKMIFLLLFLNFCATLFAQQGKEILYVGTFSVRDSEGIYVFQFDRRQGTLQLLQAVKTIESPSFLAIHPSGKFLYSVNRGNIPEQKKSGSVSAYAIDQSSGMLTLLNHKPSYGSGPCHISIDQTGSLTFVSNYTEGTLTVLRLNNDGSLGELADSIRYFGSSVNKERQDKPHIHSATPSPDNRFVFVADLGTDRVYAYKFDINTGKLKPAAKAFVELKPGTGPRHFTFHPNGKYAYVAEELSSSVGVLSYESGNGTLTVIDDRVTSLPHDFKGNNTSADIHTDPSGKFLMLSNRGHDALAMFKIDDKGKLKQIGNQSTPGKRPRNFLIDHNNQYIFVAHQDTDNIVVFHWDPKNGKLTDSGVQEKVPSPVCLKMVTLGKK